MKYIYYLFLITFLLSIYSIVFIGVINVYPYRHIYVQEPIEILNKDKQVKSGENISFLLKWDKKNHYPAIVYRALICNGGWQYHFDPIPENLPLGKHEGTSSYTKIPDISINDRCHLEFNVFLDLGILGQRKSVIFKTEEFDIIDSNE